MATLTEFFPDAETMLALEPEEIGGAILEILDGRENRFSQNESPEGSMAGRLRDGRTMVAVGMFAAHLGGRALWLVPLSFVAMMAVGGALGMAGFALPFVEIGVALSVVILGIAVATGVRITTAAAMALVGFFAIFHGHVHGAEMPETASGLEYAAGFVLATASLHAFGIGLGLSVGRMSEISGGRVLRVAGSAMALAGVAILTGYL